MIAYFDTSAIVPIVIEEPGSLTAVTLWDEADRVVSSRLAYAEARAALALATRINRITTRQLRRAVTNLEDLFDQLDLVEVTDAIVRRAGELAEAAALRGSDAVHLSSAEQLADRDLVFAAGDQELLRGASDLTMHTADVTISN